MVLMESSGSGIAARTETELRAGPNLSWLVILYLFRRKTGLKTGTTSKNFGDRRISASPLAEWEVTNGCD